VDIKLYIAVVRRHKKVFVVGLIVAVGLAVLAAFKVSSSGLKYRTDATWGSTTSLLVSQPGYPIGSAGNGPNFDPARVAYLASIYVQLAQSDEVRSAVVGPHGSVTNGKLSIDNGRIRGSYTATQILSADGSQGLPIVTIAAESNSRENAKVIALRATAALRYAIQSAAVKGNVPKSNRIQLSQLAGSNNTAQIKGHGKVLPIIAFLFGVIGTLALIFFLENLARERAALEAARETGPSDEQRVPASQLARAIEAQERHAPKNPSAEPAQQARSARRSSQRG
jgi:capsular polysaccharide biosynthesis protein